MFMNEKIWILTPDLLMENMNQTTRKAPGESRRDEGCLKINSIDWKIMNSILFLCTLTVQLKAA